MKILKIYYKNLNFYYIHFIAYFLILIWRRNIIFFVLLSSFFILFFNYSFHYFKTIHRNYFNLRSFVNIFKRLYAKNTERSALCWFLLGDLYWKFTVNGQKVSSLKTGVVLKIMVLRIFHFKNLKLFVLKDPFPPLPLLSLYVSHTRLILTLNKSTDW